MSKCYSSSNITATSSYVGGLIGQSYAYTTTPSIIEDCYAVGTITGGSYIGGFIGSQNAQNASQLLTVRNVYTSTRINTINTSGGLTSYTTASTTNTNNYWIPNAQKIYASPAGTMLNIDASAVSNSYTGFDFALIWNISSDENNKSFPYLKELPIPEKVYVDNSEYRLGTGTVADPIEIKTEEDLHYMRNYPTYSYRLMNDITIDKYSEWTPIAGFGGTLYGDNHKITGLKMSVAGSTRGLFANTIAGAKIENLTLENVNIEVTSGSTIGALIGSAVSTTVNNVHVRGKVSGAGSYIGGLVGVTATSTVINNSSSDAIVTNTGAYTGGIVGQLNTSSSIANSSSTGNIIGTSYTGGLVGRVLTSNVTASNSTGNVSGTQYVGGLIGQTTTATCTIDSSYASGKVTATSDSAGGLIRIYNIYEY